MKIKQLCCNAGEFFRRGLVQKYNLVNYTNHNEPVLFFGCYGEKQIETICAHKSLAVLCWAGSDAKWAVMRPDMVNKLKEAKHIRYIAISNFIEEDLKKVGIPYTSVPILPFKNDDIGPEPLGDSIYVYKPDLYGRAFKDKIKALLPHINFIECGFHDHNREGILEVYKKCFMGLRFLDHDGLSNTACEMGLMGRKVVWNGNTPNAINYDQKNIEDIVEKINIEYNNRSSSNYLQVAEKVRNFLNISDNFLNINMVTIKESKDYFEKKTAYLETYFIHKNSRLVEIIDFINKLSEEFNFKSALDLGCGVGITSEHLRKCAKQVTAIDLSEASIDVAKKRNIYSDVKYIAGNFTDMNLDSKFDIVCLFDVLEHVLPEERDKFLCNVRDHCKGVVAISIPDPDYIKKLKETNPKVLQVVDEEIRDEVFENFEILKKVKKGVYIYYVLRNIN